jgi:hypothetical protein
MLKGKQHHIRLAAVDAYSHKKVLRKKVLIHLYLKQSERNGYKHEKSYYTNNVSDICY